MPEHGFDFYVVMVVDDLFVEHVGEGDISEAFLIAESVFEEAASYYTGSFANGLGTKFHFILEDTEYIRGEAFDRNYGEYLQ